MMSLISYDKVFNTLFSNVFGLSDTLVSIILLYLGCDYEATHISDIVVFNYERILFSKCNKYDIYYKGNICPYCKFNKDIIIYLGIFIIMVKYIIYLNILDL